jgi:hypothetical protein
MTIRVANNPRQIYQAAKEAKDGELEAVSVPPEVLMRYAEDWLKDREKIRYLESLIIRIGRA